jgi:acetyl esterase/lipase
MVYNWGVSQLLLLRYLAEELPKTAMRRARRGPLSPGWSFPFEAFVAGMRRFGNDVAARSFPEQRAHWEALGAGFDPIQRRVRRTKVYADGVPAEWFIPHEQRSNATLVYFHGGAYVSGSPSSHRHTIARLAVRTGARVLAADYRLAPEHPMPAALEDAVRVLRWVRGSGVPTSRTIVAGDSAGGGLTASALVALRDAGDPLPAGAALLCPWVDLSAWDGTMITNQPLDWLSIEHARGQAAAYLAGADPRDPRASPRYADLRGLPPMLVQVGGVEDLLDQVRDFASAAREQGVDVRLRVYDEMVHDWQCFAGVFRELGTAFDEIALFADERTRTSPARAAVVREGATSTSAL